MNIIGGYQDTRNNNKDIALTPYLFGVGVFSKENTVRVYGLGLCWLYGSIYIAIGFNVPKEYGGFRILKSKK